MPKLLAMGATEDIFKDFLNPLIRLLIGNFYVVIVVNPYKVWDMRNENDKAEIKEPVSESAVIVLLNISTNPVKISGAGIRFKDGEEWILDDFDLPVEIEGHDRGEFKLHPNTFEKLKKIGLENVKYFYLEDRLFHRFKARLSKKDIDRLLKPYYLVKGA
jgi:hypothetical protein